MHVVKPSWVVHQDDKKKKSTIFSISVHPDCSRLATGSLDAKIKIWSTLPILSESIASDDSNPKLLCTLALHNGPVLTVRWAHHGRYLASGSDDGVVMVWDLDPSGGGKIWGSDDVNVENWKPLKRLVGHESDVADLAWNMDDSMIASVGLDSTVFIWDGYSFDRIRRIDQHQGFVKGVCWDPVGQFLATQSDDKSVKIWSTEDWSLIATVTKPFQSSPANTFFRRLSWSPEGSFIAASNAMNGPVFVASVIDRDLWDSDISFVGHENTIQVAAFNPRLFADDGTGQVMSTMLALGADDNSISIWKNSHTTPLVVVKDIFERQILDLSWSNDGLSVYGCSSDGTICAITFDASEVPTLMKPEAAQIAVEKWGYTKRRPVRHPSAAARAVPAFAPTPAGSIKPNGGFGGVNILSTKPVPQKVTIMPNGKRRIQPSLIATLASTEALDQAQYEPAVAIQSTAGAFAAAAEQPLESQSRIDVSRQAMLMDVNTATGDLAVLRNRPAGQVRGRVLGGDQPGESGAVKELRPAYTMPSFERVGGGPILPVPKIQSVVRVTAVDAANVDVTAQNDAHGGPTTITYRAAGQTQWADVINSAVVGIAVSGVVSAIAAEDATLTIYSASGVRKLPTIKLDSVVSYIDVCKYYVMVITTKGMLLAWNVRTRQALFDPVNIATLLADLPTSSTSSIPTITNATIRPNGTPLIQLSSGLACAYDAAFRAWEEVSTTWWAANSPMFGRGVGVVGNIEASAPQGPAAAHKQEAWWGDAITLGHLETRLHACALLYSPVEYRENLLEYARQLASQGYGNKAEELAKELYGPVYRRIEVDEWSPTICGLSKRDLFKEVLGVFAAERSSPMSELVAEWMGIQAQAGMEM